MTPPKPAIRVSAVPFPGRYELPSRPPAPAGVAVDAYRQAQFLLAADLGLFQQAMNFQLRVVADSAPSRYRTHALAALMGLWSRVFAYLADGCALAVRGAYVSVLPLLRAACECIAAQQQLAGQEMAEFNRWLVGGIQQNRTHAALEFALGRYRAGSTLAEHQRLGAIYRVVSDLCQAHFGATILQVAPESNLQRLAIRFADNAFHLGWAELVMGWLLAAADVQLEVVTAQPKIFALSEQLREERSHLARQIEEVLHSPLRCHVQEVNDPQGKRRYLFRNFRRQAGADPRKILL